MASPLQLETPEQKRLRIEQEKLQQQMGNIGFSSIESPAPVETTELPKQTVSSLQSLKNFAKTIPSYEQDTSVPVSIDVPKVDTAFTFEDLQKVKTALADCNIQVEQCQSFPLRGASPPLQPRDWFMVYGDTVISPLQNNT